MAGGIDGPDASGRSDVVVVGAGTAGSLVAAAAARAGRHTLLLEEGPDAEPDLVARLFRQPEVVRSDLVRRYADPRPGGGAATLLSGRILGGGWSVNHGAFVHPTSADLAALADVGGDAWAPDRLVALLAALTTDVDGAGLPWQGTTGPVRVARYHRRGADAVPAARDLIAACEASGVPYLDDVNRPGDTTGITAYPYTVSPDGRRISSASTVLAEARRSGALTVLGDATVLRVVLEAGRAVGVEVVRDGRTLELRADEVVLCAGVFHSPQLLQRSGIGPSDALAAAGVTPLVALPGVGPGFRDHAKVEVDLAYRPTAEDRAAGDAGDGLKLHLRLRSSHAGVDPDLDLGLRHLPEGGAVLTVRLLDHRSTGEVLLDPDDPSGPPRVRSGLLRHPDDVAAVVDGIRIGVAILERPELGGRYALPGPRPTVEDWTQHALSTCGSYNHGVGTCRMGRDPADGAVVGPDLRVHNVPGLRVADASVLPMLPHANTNAAAALVGMWVAEGGLV